MITYQFPINVHLGGFQITNNIIKYIHLPTVELHQRIFALKKIFFFAFKIFIDIAKLPSKETRPGSLGGAAV